MTVAGVALGLAGAWAFRHLLATQLFGVHPTDPTVLATTLAVLTSTTLLAATLPARRAASVDPARALRGE